LSAPYDKASLAAPLVCALARGCGAVQQNGTDV